MTIPWKRIEFSGNGVAKRPSAMPVVQATSGQDGPPLTRTLSGGTDGSDEWEKLYVPVAPRLRYADVVLPPAVKAQLEDALAVVGSHQIVYERWGLAAKDPYGGGLSLNFYGPPGTGKSMTAEAIADRLGRPLIRVKLADLISKFVGDTNKGIAGTFRAAERSGAVLIFEEADSLLGSRFRQPTSGADKSVNDAVSEMLTALDRHKGIVVFTTNLFSNYDAAFLRRILAHVRFDLPDVDGRRRLWQNLVPETMPVAAEVTAERLAEASDGFSGAEMVKVVQLAASKAATRCGDAGPVTWVDFEEALARERAAKDEHQGGLRTVSASVVTEDELPAEAKRAYANAKQSKDAG